MTGDVVVKGRTLDVSVDPAQLIDHLDWPVIVPAWMSHAEARRGPLSLFNDIVWADVTGSGGFSRTFHGRRAAATFGADIDVDYGLAIVEAGGAYTVWSQGRQGSPGSTAFDFLAGARWWHQDIDVSADLTTTLTLGVPAISRYPEVARLRNPAVSIGSIRSSGRAYGSSWRLARRSSSAATLVASAPAADSHGRPLPPITHRSV
jgi:hypothetical protein